MEPQGRNLRARVADVDELLTEIGECLKEEEDLDVAAVALLERIKEDMDRLFYMIPLEVDEE